MHSVDAYSVQHQQEGIMDLTISHKLEACKQENLDLNPKPLHIFPTNCIM